ncbi:MAG TPA: amino acid adenylation domain-containing protein, partial [Ktedonobacteraceae bacterium]|nr:amino acid adenylation domain-containing protein [Ktedonobacteraceae bacterium]
MLNTTYSTLLDLLSKRACEQSTHGYAFISNAADDGFFLSYQDLEKRARVLAALLQSFDGAGQRALLVYSPGPEYIVAFFGCLYAGVVAVPVYPPHPHRPMPRLQHIAEDAQARFVLTTTNILSTMQARVEQVPTLASLQWVATDALDVSLASQWREPTISVDSLAFFQYTSGSTSAPKGVMITHRNLLYNSHLIHQCCDEQVNSHIVSWLPPYHDMGLIGAILQPLYVGCSATLMPPTLFLQNPFRWLRCISETRANISVAPNFAYDLCVQSVTAEQRETLDLSHWNMALSGAEPIRPMTIESFSATFAECGFRRASFYPCYGLAEATLIVSGGNRSEEPVTLTVQADALRQDEVREAVDEADSATHSLIGCGQALPGQRILVVDPASSLPCLPRQIGEIWVAGPSIARGYWQKPAETEHTFHAHLASDGDGPFLRTGDLGFLHNDQLFITGRLKDLLIIRGRNYYPQDIELTVQQSHAGFRMNCTAAFCVDVHGENKLVVVQEVKRQYRRMNVDEAASLVRQLVVREHGLSVYALVLIHPGSMPKTSSGKIQRAVCQAAFLNGTLNALGASLQDAPPSPFNTEEAPRLQEILSSQLSPSERIMRIESFLQYHIACLLQIPRHTISAHEALSSVALDSLMLAELRNRIESDLGVMLTLEYLFADRSIAQIAVEIAALLTPVLPQETQTTSTNSQHSSPHNSLTVGEEALWFLYRLAPDSSAYTISRAVLIHSPLNSKMLKKAFQTLLDRHPSLRTTFHLVNEKPVRHIDNNQSICFHIVDSATWEQEALDRHLLEEANRPFQLEEAPLLRVHIFTRPGNKHILLLTIHHIIADLWSLAVLLDELGKLYTAEFLGIQLALPAPQTQVSDYARWQLDFLSSEAGRKSLSYWQGRLADAAPVLNLPHDRPRPSLQTYNGSAYYFELPAVLSEQLRELCREQKVTPYMLLLSLFQILLYKYTNQEDILVGSPVATRNQQALQNVVGYFINSVVMRAHDFGSLSFNTFLAQNRQDILAALKQQEYPFPLLVKQLRPERDSSYHPLFQVMFALQKDGGLRHDTVSALALNSAGAPITLGELQLESLALPLDTVQFDLALTMAEVDTTFAAAFQYNVDLFDEATIIRMSDAYLQLLQTIVANPDQSIDDITILSEAEQQQLLVTWNATQHPQSETQQGLHTLFMKVASSLPDAIAVVHEENALTYAELDQRSTHLARYLLQQGLSSESLVGLYVERSIDMVVGMLGILKAGCAYVPLDPTYPAERLAFLLRDATISVLLTQEDLVSSDSFPDFTGAIVCLDQDWSHFAASECTLPPVVPQQIAYMIYTSGSTGLPKGVCCSHQNVLNLLADFETRQALQPHQHASLWTNMSFDVSVYEIFSPLIKGASLYIIPDVLRAESVALFRWLQLHQIQSAYLPPFVLRNFAAWLTSAGRSFFLRRLLVGVEPIAMATLQAIMCALPELHIINGYGPTEATICATLFSVDKNEIPAQQNAPIGRPVHNTQVYVLNAHLQPVPVGVPGELYIGGAGVSRGYYRRPELTAERFVPHPFAEQAGQRLYRTGDLVRYLPTGQLEY